MSANFSGEDSDKEHLIDVMIHNFDKIKNDASVFDVQSNMIDKNEIASAGIYNYFKSIGGKALNPRIGIVELNKKGAKSTTFHGIGKEKYTAVVAIRPVIEKGKIVDFQSNWKNRGYDTYAIIGKGLISNKENVIGVIVKSYPKNNLNNKFYLHEVIKIGVDSDTTVDNNTTHVNESTPTINNVSQDKPVVNTHSMQNGGNNSSKERSRIASAAEANRENLDSAAEYEKLRGAIEQLKGKSEGGIVVNEHSIALKKRDITSYVSIQKMAQDLGMKAIIVEGLFEDSEQALDGIITPQVVFIDVDAENPARFVATHEFSHRMKQAAAKEWKKYQDYVIKVLNEKKLTGSNKTAYEVLYDATRKAYGNKSDNYIHKDCRKRKKRENVCVWISYSRRRKLYWK